MSEIAERIKNELTSLSAEDRADLAFFLLQSLDEREDEGWAESWSKELEQRSAEVKAGAVQEIPAEQVVSELRKKYS